MSGATTSPATCGIYSSRRKRIDDPRADIQTKTQGGPCSVRRLCPLRAGTVPGREWPDVVDCGDPRDCGVRRGDLVLAVLHSVSGLRGCHRVCDELLQQPSLGVPQDSVLSVLRNQPGLRARREGGEVTERAVLATTIRAYAGSWAARARGASHLPCAIQVHEIV